MMEIKIGDRGFLEDVFTHRGRLCVIIRMSFMPNPSREFLEGALAESDYCNGYVQVGKKGVGQDYDKFAGKIETEEITFSGQLPFSDAWFIGFDTAHIRNDMNPISKTKEEVKKKTIQLCNEMIRKGI